MNEPARTHPPAIDPSEIAAVFGLDSPPAARDITWSDRLDQGVAGATVGVWSVEIRNSSAQERAILKIISAENSGHSRWAPSSDQDNPMFWRREADAYSSGALGALPATIAAPALIKISDFHDGAVGIWTRTANGRPGDAWGLDDYERAAQLLGAAQGALESVAQRPEPWMSSGWLRKYAGTHGVDEDMLAFAAGEGASMYETLLPEPCRHDLLWMWRNRDRHLTILEGLPKTFCHLDFWPPNLFLPKDGPLMLVDWAYSGIGCFGEDAGNLVPDAVHDGFLDSGVAAEAFDLVFDAYVAGLRQSGNGIDSNLARLGYLLSGVVKYGWVAPATLGRLFRPSPDTTESWLEAARHRFAMGGLLASNARAAETLIATVGLT